MSGTNDHHALLLRSLEEIERLEAKIQSLERGGREPIAVIGIGCRFPGGASDPERFWRLLLEGVDAVSPVPRERWDAEALYDSDPRTPWRTHIRNAALLEDVEGFDASFFGISPREAMSMDPQHRLFLEVAWHALEDAGLTKEALEGSRTGVFAGVCSNDRQNLQLTDIADLDAVYFGVGTAHNMLAGRLSYLLDLKGPNVAIDTACSSSLVATHLACQSLRAGESDLALAGGVNLILSPLSLLLPGKMDLMAADGRSRTFDAAADGMGRGEGCGIVLLRRLADAIASRDRILAVIRGSAINQDGRTTSLTAPNGSSQEAVITTALRNAGIAGNRVSYVETHGTATRLGDPIEVDALRAAIGAGDGIGCGLGAIKSNIGHTEAAAGIAGLIKVVLALRHRMIPPQPLFRELNPNISLDGTRFFIPTVLRPWTVGEETLVAGVSSFGWSGTNAHVVLEEAVCPATASSEFSGPFVLSLSAKTPSALKALVEGYSELLNSPTPPALHDVCYTAFRRRTHFEHRVAFVAGDPAEMLALLARYGKGTPHPGIIAGTAPRDRRPGIVFVFPGQGSQWIGMGRNLLATHAGFRAAIERCDIAFRPYMAWSVTDALKGTGDAPDLTRIDVIQPVLFAMEIALATVLRKWGIEPDAVAGHSMGEIAAAHFGGALTLNDAARIICLRSSLLMSERGRGAMLMVDLSQIEAEHAIAGYERRVSIGVCNSPRSTVLSGDPEALDEIARQLESQAVFSRRVRVDVASHSPQMEPILAPLLQALEGIQPLDASTPVYSTVTGCVSTGRDLSAKYWAQNLRQPVLFSAAVESLAQHGHTVFVEISPHPILLPSVEETLRAANAEGVAVPLLRREEDETSALLRAIATLHVNGCPVEWSALVPEGQCVALPLYPFEHQRFESRVPDAFMESLLSAAQSDPGFSQWPTLPEKDNDGIVSSFYDDLVDLSGDSEEEDAHLLTWGVFPRVIEGFSWLRTILSPDAVPAHRLLLADAQKRMRQALLAPVDLSAVRHVLDFGCGHAADLLRMAEEYPHLRLDGYTISARQAELGRKRARARGLGGRLRILHRDSTSDEFPGSYELMLGFEVIGLIRDKAGLFANIERHLSPGGALLITDFVANTLSPIDAPDTSTYSSTKAEWASLFAEHHLRLVEGVDVSPEVANCLHDPHYAETLSQLAAEGGLNELSVRSFASYENVYKALRSGLLSYVLLHAQRDPYARVEDLRAVNSARLDALAPWTEISARRAHLTRDSINEWLHELQWCPDPVVRGGNSVDVQGEFWIIADCRGVARAVQEKLESRGQTCIVFNGEENFERLGRERAENCRAVVHLCSLDAPSTHEATLESLRASEKSVSLSALATVQSLARYGLRDAPRLWLVTAGAQPVSGRGVPIAIAQSPLWGLGGAIVHEHPELRCVRFDFSANPTDDEIAVFCEELIADGTEDQIAVRGDKRFVARLTAGTARPRETDIEIRADATYLITGGHTGVGLRTAQWLVENGARHLALVSRSGGDAASLDGMRSVGAEIRSFAADVSDPAALASVLAALDASMPPLRGVVHSAVVLEDGVLLRQTEASFRKAMAPKMDGAWNLHTQTRERELDFFLLYSSLVSMLGTPGQGNYAAASAFLDALAHQRRAEGLPAISINWPPWSEIGQAAASDRGARIASRGLHSVKPDEGMQILGRLLNHDAAQIGVMRLDLRQWRQFYPRAASVPLLAEIAREQERAMRSGQKETQPAHSVNIAAELQSLDSGERRRDALTAHVREQLAVILRVDPPRVDAYTPLKNLGFDSLMVVELRNRLELSLGIRLTAAAVFSYPTIATLVPYLAAKMQLLLDSGSAQAATQAEVACGEQEKSQDRDLESLADELLRDLEATV